MNLRRWIWSLALAAAAGWAGALAEPLAVGEVKVDAAARSLWFPATVNMREGQVEYFVVHETGKIHESLFKTTVGARDIHAAALLFSTSATNRLQIKAIEVSWQEGAETKRVQAADLIYDKDRRRVLKETRWAYRGSRVVDGIFLAQRDGSQIAIMEDRDALIDQNTPDAANDENWTPVNMPPPGTTVEIRLVFEKPAEQSQKPAE